MLCTEYTAHACFLNMQQMSNRGSKWHHQYYLKNDFSPSQNFFLHLTGFFTSTFRLPCISTLMEEQRTRGC